MKRLLIILLILSLTACTRRLNSYPIVIEKIELKDLNSAKYYFYIDNLARRYFIDRRGAFAIGDTLIFTLKGGLYAGQRKQ